jgi:hypothetical protein
VCEILEVIAPEWAFTEAFEQPCPDRGQRLIETPE